VLVVPGSTHTAEEAAVAAGCALGQIIKTLVVYVAGTPKLALVAGDRRLDDRLLSARFGVGRKQVKLASAEQVLELTGYPVGGVCPLGLPAPLPVLVDENLRRFEVGGRRADRRNAIQRIGPRLSCVIRRVNRDRDIVS
jgi:prolyl-tRNA editing enzyme YbaK/EbsC (Cys-tRNA(Pro) deacylase)